MTTASAGSRRPGVTAVHSMQRFVLSVPNLDDARRFYSAFGLDVRDIDGRLDLYTYGHPHRWGSIYAGRGPKRLEYLSFHCYAEDYEALAAQVRRHGAAAPHPLADEDGIWCTDPDGTPVQVRVGPKVMPSQKDRVVVPPAPDGTQAAPNRAKVKPIRPRRLAHILLFCTDVPKMLNFYCGVLGLRLADHSGDGIAFMFGAHGSDHHLVALLKSDGPGLHHSSWDMASIDDVGLGMQQMLEKGYGEGWGVGRHVLGSNYFRYVRDPWGSFAEYSYDIDFIPADCDWKPGDHPPEDSFYVWGPNVPDYFGLNTETAGRKASLAAD